jgi:hypothetical protein
MFTADLADLRRFKEKFCADLSNLREKQLRFHI